MRAGIDTSVLLRLLVGEPKAQAVAALQAMEEWRNGSVSVVVSRLVLAETYYALQHHYQVPKAEALRQLLAFVTSPWIARDEVAIEALSTRRLASAKPGFIDRLIHGEYRAGLRADVVATFEKSAAKLDGTRLLVACSG